MNLSELTPVRLNELRIQALTGGSPPEDWHEILITLMDQIARLKAKNRRRKKRSNDLQSLVNRRDSEISRLDAKLMALELKLKKAQS